MSRMIIFFMMAVVSLLVPSSVRGAIVEGSVNTDGPTIAAMESAFLIQQTVENQNLDEIRQIFKHYTHAEVAAAGIFTSKWFDRRAMTHAGLFGSSQENAYYRRIHSLVSTRLMPKIFTVASMLIKYPERAMYWGPYLFRICEETRQLCMVFEVVVTNGECSFRDIRFLGISAQLAPFFNLARLGNGSMDWEGLLDHIADDSGMTLDWRDLRDDIEDLVLSGRNIAGAGSHMLDSAWAARSHVGSLLKNKPREISSLYRTATAYWEVFSDPIYVSNLVLSHLHSTDSTGLANLFEIQPYDTAAYYNQYFSNNDSNQHYRQKWQINFHDRGHKVLCDYEPDASNTLNVRGPEWDFVECDWDWSPDNSYIERALRNSESWTGWSRSRVDNLNTHGNGSERYTFSNALRMNTILHSSGRVYGKVLAHHIKVEHTWDYSNVVYEDVFDSQYDDENAFREHFSTLLRSYNNNRPDSLVRAGIQYQMSVGPKEYYFATDSVRMRGCSSATYESLCRDTVDILSSDFSWKVDQSHDHGLDQFSIQLAMATQPPVSGGLDTSRLDSVIRVKSDSVALLTGIQTRLKNEVRALQEQVGQSSVNEIRIIQQALRVKEDSLDFIITPLLNKTQREYYAAQEALQQLKNDYAESGDYANRIPTVMLYLQRQDTYGIKWSDDGAWDTSNPSEFVFTRRGTTPQGQSVVVFVARLTQARTESFFLGIRIHRSILQVQWQLRGYNEDKSVLETLDLDPALDAGERARLANARLRELQNAYPRCEVTMSLTYSSPPSLPDDRDAMHLLWASDRLAIAREVELRLMTIYTQLVQLEKYLHIRLTARQLLERALNMPFLSEMGRKTIHNESYEFWRRAARGAAVGESPSAVVHEFATRNDSIQN